MSVWLVFDKHWKECNSDLNLLAEYLAKEGVSWHPEQAFVNNTDYDPIHILGSFGGGAIEELKSCIDILTKKYADEKTFSEWGGYVEDVLILPIDFKKVLYIEDDNYYSFFQYLHKFPSPMGIK